MTGGELPPSVQQYFGALQHSGAPGDEIRWKQGEAGRERLGTRIRWWLLLDAERVQAARYQAYGCPYTLAACEWLAGRLESAASVGALPGLIGSANDWAQVLEIPAGRVGRLLVVEDALRAALSDSAVTQAR